jgi:signal transduction histidine kinase/ActR/RegA family two-component response regulator
MKKIVKRVANILGILLIMGFALNIIYSNYQASIEIRNRSVQRVYKDFFDKVDTVKAFLTERQKDFIDLASDRTIATYFKNKAMGMTLMYGLAISQNNVKKRIQDFQKQNTYSHDILFPKIVFLDTQKSLLTVISENFNIPITYNTAKTTHQESKEPLMQHDAVNPDFIIVSVPCVIKNKHVGSLIGWMPYTLLFDHFFQPNRSEEHFILFTDLKRKYPIFNPSIKTRVFKSDDVRQLLNTGRQTYKNPIDEKNYLIFSVEDNKMPFETVKLISTIEIFGTDNPEKLLIRMVLICSLLFIFTIMLIRINLKQQIGAVRLAEAEERHKKIEQKNKELEIARQKESDANIQLQNSQKEIESQNERLREMDRLKSEFLANMSHEIRTPMNGIIGMADLLLNTDLKDTQKRYVEIVNSSAQSLLTIINDILDFSKIEAKKLSLEHIDFDLQTLMDDIISALALKAHEKGLELVMDISSDVPVKLRGDPDRLRQIINNLVGNAVKFTHHGEIIVRIHRVSQSSDNVMLRFEVQDTGIGIPKNRQNTLFDHFTQVDTSYTRQYGGTGLGLAISKKLSEMMGGEIGVSSDDGKGSKFWFTVHLSNQDIQDQKITIPLALSNKRILIVDDNQNIRKTLKGYMNSWNMHVVETSDGFEAIQLIYKALDNHSPFHVAVIDLDMPGLRGDAIGRALMSETRLSNLRLILLYQSGTEKNFDQLSTIGFSKFLVKPIKKRDLKKALISLQMSN